MPRLASLGDGARHRLARRLRAHREILVARDFRHHPAVAAGPLDAGEADQFGIDALLRTDARDQAHLVVEVADDGGPALQQRQRNLAAPHDQRLEILLRQLGDDAILLGDDRGRSAAAIDRGNLAERVARGDVGDGDLFVPIEVVNDARVARDDEVHRRAFGETLHERGAGGHAAIGAARLEHAYFVCRNRPKILMPARDIWGVALSSSPAMSASHRAAELPHLR